MKVAYNVTLGLERLTTIHVSTSSIVCGVNACATIRATTTQHAFVISATGKIIAR